MPLTKANETSFKKGRIPWNKGKKTSLKTRKLMSEIRMKSKYRTGKGHPLWKGGCRTYYGRVANRVLREYNIKKECNICKSLDKIEAHHKDRKWKNNKIENLIYLCSSCHMKIHHSEDKNKNKCKECRKIFISGKRKSKYCSNKCRLLAWKKKQ